MGVYSAFLVRSYKAYRNCKACKGLGFRDLGVCVGLVAHIDPKS